MAELPPEVAAGVREIVERGVELWTENGELRFLAPPDVPTADLRSALRPAREYLVSLLDGGGRLAPTLLVERGPAGFDEGPNAVRSLTFDLTGPLDHRAVEAALTTLVERHETLRTAYPHIGGGPLRLIRPPMPVPVECFDGEEERLPERPSPYAPPLISAALVRRGAEEHILTLTVHGIAVDGMSLALVFDELGPLYDAAAEGRPDPLPEAPSSQRQVRRERAYLASPEAVTARDYWVARLASAPALRGRPGATGESGNSPVEVSEALADAVRDRAAAERTTPFAVLLAAYGLLLSEVTGCEDVTVSGPVANRWHPDDEGTVSGARDILALRLLLDGTTADAIAVAHRERHAALAHGRFPFDQLPPDVAPPRRPGRNPVFGALFALQAFGDRYVLSFRGVRSDLRDLPVPPVPPGIDAGLMLWPQGRGYRGDIACDGVALDAAELPGLAERYLAIVRELADGRVEEVRPGEVRDRLDADPAVAETVVDERDGRVVAYTVLREPAEPALADRLRRAVSTLHPAPLLVPVTRVPRDARGDADLAALRGVPVTDPATLARWEAELGVRAGPVAVDVVPAAGGDQVAAQEVTVTVTAPAHKAGDVRLVDRFGTAVVPRVIEE